MTTARKNLVSIADTPYYHVVSRCVRRAFLAGFDRFSNTNFEHRRQWIVDRMMGLVDIFSIDICAYSVM
ncbi:MAG TPA: transposase, partial [Oceanospirillales bacterium]|nr:transposase [Oceanospirillales bacterium]